MLREAHVFDHAQETTMLTDLRVQDLLVGGIATVTGLLSLAVALGNWSWFYQLRLARRIESSWGRGKARMHYAVLGLMLIALGVAIMTGRSPHR